MGRSEFRGETKTRRWEEGGPSVSKCLSAKPPPLRAQFDVLWAVNPSLRFQIARYATSFLLMAGTMYVCSLMSVVSDSFYSPGDMKALPDRLHDQILQRGLPPAWLYPTVDLLTSTAVILTHFRFVLVLPAPVNFQVGSRFLNITMCLYLFRALAIVVTTLPPAKPNCVPPRPHGLVEFFRDAFLQALSHNRECTGMIISGHTSVLVGCLCCWSLYGRWGESARVSRSPLSRLRRCLCLCCASPASLEEEGVGAGSAAAFWRNTFVVQFFRFLKEWIRLTRLGTADACEKAAVFAFRLRSREEAETEQSGLGWRFAHRFFQVPWLRYYCYAVAVCCICAIPSIYNHYTIDVLLAIFLTVLAWSLYHAALSVLLLQAKATGTLWQPRPSPQRALHGSAENLFAAKTTLGVGGNGSGSRSRSAESCNAVEVQVLKEANAVAVQVRGADLASAITTPSALSDAPSFRVPDPCCQLQSQQPSANAAAAALSTRFYAGEEISPAAQAEFRALHADVLFEQPLLFVLGWLLRKVEGLD